MELYSSRVVILFQFSLIAIFVQIVFPIFVQVVLSIVFPIFVQLVLSILVEFFLCVSGLPR